MRVSCHVCGSVKSSCLRPSSNACLGHDGSLSYPIAPPQPAGRVVSPWTNLTSQPRPCQGRRLTPDRPTPTGAQARLDLIQRESGQHTPRAVVIAGRGGGLVGSCCWLPRDVSALSHCGACQRQQQPGQGGRAGRQACSADRPCEERARGVRKHWFPKRETHIAALF